MALKGGLAVLILSLFFISSSYASEEEGEINHRLYSNKRDRDDTLTVPWQHTSDKKKSKHKATKSKPNKKYFRQPESNLKKKKKKQLRKRDAIHSLDDSHREGKKNKVNLDKLLTNNNIDNTTSLTQLCPTDIWFTIIQEYLDVKSVGRLRRTCHYFNELKVYPRIWKRFSAQANVLITPDDEDFERSVRAHFLIPRSFQRDTYSPTQNFFQEFVSLARAHCLGSLEATLHLKRLLEFRGQYFMNRETKLSIMAPLDVKLRGKLWQIEIAPGKSAAKHLFIGACYRHGYGVIMDSMRAYNHFCAAYRYGDQRGAIEAGRMLEQPPIGRHQSISEAEAFYRQAAESGATLGYIKLGYLYLERQSHRKARSAFQNAVDAGDPRGYKGLYNCAKELRYSDRKFKKPILSWEEYLQKFIASGDAYGLILKAKQMTQREAVALYSQAWEMGLTSDEILKGMLPNHNEIGKRYQLRHLTDLGFRRTFEGISSHDRLPLQTAIRVFDEAGLGVFSAYLNNILQNGF